MDKQLLGLLVCPICKGALSETIEKHELICAIDKLAFPIRDGIPIMLIDEGLIVTGIL